MKIILATILVWQVTTALSSDCPEHCVCSDGIDSVARCSQLNSDVFFPERVKHLVVESTCGLQLNLTKSFFKNIGLQQATSIKINNCTISFIDVGAFEDLQQLTDVDLSNNGLILIHPDTFENNTQLARLVLRDNPLQLTQLLKAEENYFLKSMSLLELDLSHCELSDIGKKLLSQLPGLQYISLRSNNIKVIDDYIFENVPFLDEVDLSNNMIISLNDGIFEDIEELTTLNLKNNRIENIDDLDIPGLKELDVSHNNIKLLRKTTFEGIPDLSSLNISHNGITWISEETFKDLVELKHLDLSHNALMGPLAKFLFEENEDLETLFLSGNREMHVFEGFSTELPQLYNLDISDCGLTTISNSSFSGMPSLAILNISKNSLTSLNHAIMSKLHRLNVLDVSYNNINKVGAYTFASNSHLKILNLSNNKIHYLSPNTFETTPYLSNLDVSYNLFTHIWHANDSDYMKDNGFLKQLEYLNIAGNRIKDLHKHSFGHLENLKALNILDNPLECTSEFPTFIEWLYTSHIKPLKHESKTEKIEDKPEMSNLQWDDLLMDVCKTPESEQIIIKTKPVSDKEIDLEKGNGLNFYQYTVIEDVKLTEAKQSSEPEFSASHTNEKVKLEELTNYVWPTFLVVFFIVFLTLAIGNTIALLIYRSRSQYNSAGLRTTFVSPFKRTIVKLDTTTPRYHKLYEECSVPNTPIVKSNLLGTLVNTHKNGAVLTKPTNNDVV